MNADDLDLFAALDLALLDSAGHDGAAAGDREDVLDRHQERLVDVALGLRDIRVDRLHQLVDLRRPLRVAFERLERRERDDRNIVTGELELREQITHFDLDQLEKLRVIDHIGLVEGHHDVGHLDLASEQDVLARLRHRAVGGGDDEDRTVHLGGARDHVLDVVGVPWAVDVRVVPVRSLVLDVRRVDGDTALTLFRRVVDRVEGTEGGVQPLLLQNFCNSRRQRRFPVVDVTDGADVEMRLGALEFLLCHVFSSGKTFLSDWWRILSWSGLATYYAEAR